jgi:hypothetical protein
MIWKFWRWTFARLYLEAERPWGGAAGFAASLALMATILVNALTVLFLLDPLLDSSRILTVVSKLEFVIAGFVLSAVIYLHYVVGGEATELIEQMRRQRKNRARRERRRLLYYALASWGLLVLSGLLGIYLRKHGFGAPGLFAR